MDKLMKLGIALALAGGLAVPALAQNSATTASPTQGSATIVAPITLTENSTLRFGSMVKPTNDNTNTITVGTGTCATAITGTGNGALVSSTSGCATYTAGGESGQAFSISNPATFNLSNGNGGTITVNLTRSANSGTIGQSSADFKVGGNFNIDKNTPSGAYTGEFAVTVTYQ
ncbi:MAG TPA: DUF4402 domain-containing protein [Allosphingosinicella sp.]|nr:DUF4402 domain-containing protein [Allosphingosinicella sp.]